MNDKFCEWYEKVCKNTDRDQLENRLSALEKYCNSDDIDILSLSTLFFQLPTGINI